MSATFVGRDAELAMLVGLFSRHSRTRGPLVAVVSGAPGIGKSRLLGETVSRLGGVKRFHLAGHEPERRVSLAAARDLLHTIAAEALPPSGEPTIEGTAPVAVDETLRVFEAVYQTVAEVLPVLLVVDDLQWVDEASGALVHYLLRAAETSSLPIGFLCATRPESNSHVLIESFRRLLGDPERFVDVSLQLIDDDAARTLVRSIARDAEDSLVADWCASAEGSPFWLELLAGGNREASSVADLVASRISGLTGDEANLLYLLSLIGHPVPGVDVAGALGWDETRIDDAMAGLAALGLSRETGRGLQVAHDLIRREVNLATGAELRRRLHERWAAWLEGEAGSGLSPLLEALEHRNVAGLVTEDLALRIASSPQRRLLGEEGVERLVEFSAVAGSRPLDLAVAALAAEVGQHELAFHLWTQLTEKSDVDQARAALAASASALELRLRDDAWRMLEKAQQYGSGDAAFGVEMDAHRSRLHRNLDSDPMASYHAAMNAVNTARAVMAAGTDAVGSVRRAHMSALLAAAEAALSLDEPTEMLAFAEELEELSAGVDPALRSRAFAQAGLALRMMGRNEQAERRLRVGWSEARRFVLPEAMLEIGTTWATVLVSLGRLGEAEAVTSECLALDLRLVALRPARAFSILLPHILVRSKGDWREAERGLDEAAQREANPHIRQHAHLERALTLARLDPSHSAADVVASIAHATSDAAGSACRRCITETAFRGAEALARTGSVREARERWNEAQDSVRGPDAYMAWWRARAEASILSGEGELEASQAALAWLIDEADRQGQMLEAVWARIDLGAALVKSDSTAAAQILREAGRIAESMGALTEQRLAERGLRQLGVRTWRRGPASSPESALGALSARERDIALLVGSGATNPEIAGSLFISRKTVERHVSNILAKLGVRNRAELARVLTEHAVEPEGSPR